MGETFTKSLNAVINQAQMKESEVHENLDADDLIFYHSSVLIWIF